MNVKHSKDMRALSCWERYSTIIPWKYNTLFDQLTLKTNMSSQTIVNILQNIKNQVTINPSI